MRRGIRTMIRIILSAFLFVQGIRGQDWLYPHMSGLGGISPFGPMGHMGPMGHLGGYGGESTFGDDFLSSSGSAPPEVIVRTIYVPMYNNGEQGGGHHDQGPPHAGLQQTVGSHPYPIYAQSPAEGQQAYVGGHESAPYLNSAGAPDATSVQGSVIPVKVQIPSGGHSSQPLVQNALLLLVPPNVPLQSNLHSAAGEPRARHYPSIAPSLYQPAVSSNYKPLKPHQAKKFLTSSVSPTYATHTTTTQAKPQSKPQQNSGDSAKKNVRTSAQSGYQGSASNQKATRVTVPKPAEVKTVEVKAMGVPALSSSISTSVSSTIKQ